MWVLLSLAYGLLKGFREIFKKKAMQRDTRIDVLFFYTLLSFVWVLPATPVCIKIAPILLLPVFCKSAVLFAAWMFAFASIEKMPVSSYGVLDLSRVLFSTLLSVTVLSEHLKWNGILGLILVSAGLLMMGIQPKGKRADGDTTPAKYVILAVASCLLNSVSALIDKKALATELSSLQMLYWYLLFMLPMYAVYLLVTRHKISLKTVARNPWVWILSIFFVVAEYSLFRANAITGSLVSVMTLMKQASCFVTILAGKFVFGEKQIGKKLLCAGVVLCGIVISVML